MYKFIIVLFLCTWFQQDVEVIAWHPNYRLEWSDFQAKPKKNNDVVAVTASGLTFGYSTKKYSDGRIDYDFEVTAHFYPEKSYYLKDHVTAVTLEHERLHFDITELFARKFRARVKATRFTHNIDREMERIHQEINTELREMQKQYDDETDHSREVEIQFSWNAAIAKALEDTSNFAEY